jgi:cyclophilin family peptidyl-prolyl cis-trans isomerase
VRALATYSDSAAIAALVGALGSTDSWIAVSAAEGLGRIRSAATVPRLVAAAAAKRSCAVRITAMQALQTFALGEAMGVAVAIMRDTVPLCRLTAIQTLMRDTTGTAVRSGARTEIDRLLDDRAPAVRSAAWQAHFTFLDATLAADGRRSARRTDLASADPIVRAAALRTMAPWADTSDLPTLFDQYERTRADSSPVVASAAVAAIAAVQRRHGVGGGGAAFLARFTSPENPILRRDIDRAFGAAVRAAWGLVPPPSRALAEYRQIVERWVVPDYNGAPRPTSRWQTPRGAIELELYPGDAPLAVDDFVRTIESGAIVGTEFSRVVPDFVDQQRTIRDGNVLRDEVNRHRLTRANLAWATAGLDTGSPGYTLNHTPQPHNEGDFTSMGRVISGMDAVDRIELGDRIIAARMMKVESLKGGKDE